MVVTDEQRARSVPFKHHLYATLDFVPPSQADKTGQRGRVYLPTGWEVSPNADEIVAAVISKHKWGCSCLAVADGMSIATELGSTPGGVVRKSMLQCVDDGLMVKDTPDLSCRILIRHMTSLNIIRPRDDILTLVSKELEDSRFTDCTPVCCSEDLPRHRFALATSPVSKQTLSTDMRDGSENCTDTSPHEPCHVRMMLDAMYTGQVEFDERLPAVMLLAHRHDCQAVSRGRTQRVVEFVDADTVFQDVRLYRLSSCEALEIAMRGVPVR